MKSYKKPKEINCNKYPKNWLYIDENGVLQATEYAKLNYDINTIKCNGEYFERITDNKLKYVTVTEVITIGYKVNNGDYLKLNCSTTNNDKWKHLFMTIAPKKSLIQASSNTTRPNNWSGLSVYWFSLDSMSHMAYKRLLPDTVEYLEQNNFIILNGYNIVGDGTPQAFIPILTGKTELELPLTRKRYSNANYVDVYPFIWKNFSDLGYITMYGEDAAKIGTFTYRLKGFKNQPTDHYTRTFFMLSENFFPSYKCFGNEKQYNVWLRYTKEFFTKYSKDLPKFAMMHHGDITHNDVTLIKNADKDIKNHFKELLESKMLQDTVIFVGADHGHRFASFRQTQQGQQEERLPFMAIKLPDKFIKTEKGLKMYQNLKNNAEKLTTPFDMYSTFEDILQLPDNVDTTQDIKKRSLSLFRPIPEDRTCEQAGVEPHWCTCLKWQKSDQNIAEKLSNAVVKTINDYTSKERDLCSLLHLHEVVESKVLIPDEKLLKYGGNSDFDGFVAKFTGKASLSEYIYMLTFITVPGNARYEATVEYDDKKDEITVDMLSISHVNKYGDTPHCIIDKNYFLAAYCVCYDKV